MWNKKTFISNSTHEQLMNMKHEQLMNNSWTTYEHETWTTYEHETWTTHEHETWTTHEQLMNMKHLTYLYQLVKQHQIHKKLSSSYSTVLWLSLYADKKLFLSQYCTRIIKN